jgi:hypothetical protein
MNQQVNVRYNALDSFLNEATGTDSSSSFVLYAILSPPQEHERVLSYILRVSRRCQRLIHSQFMFNLVLVSCKCRALFRTASPPRTAHYCHCLTVLQFHPLLTTVFSSITDRLTVH